MEYVNYTDLCFKNDIKNIINNNNHIIIKELCEKYNEKSTVNIIGKGNTAKYIQDSIGINQGSIFTNNKIIFMNDFSSIFGLENYIKKTEYLFIPDHPHIKNKPDKEKNFIFLLKYVNSCGFKGKVFIYQTQSSLSPKIEKWNIISHQTTDVPITIFNKFFGVKNYNLYGVGKGPLYHEDLKKLDFSISKTKVPDLFLGYDNFFWSNFDKETSIYSKVKGLKDYWKHFRKDLNIILN